MVQIFSKSTIGFQKALSVNYITTYIFHNTLLGFYSVFQIFFLHTFKITKKTNPEHIVTSL